MLLLMFPWGEVARAEEPAVPFPEAVHAAAISVDRLDSILDYGLLLGNGDLNALVSSEGGRLDLARAVVNVAGVADGPSEAKVRALADRNVLLIKTSAASQLLRTSSADVPQAVIGEDDGVAERARCPL